jgi:hypothetical protein
MSAKKIVVSSTAPGALVTLEAARGAAVAVAGKTGEVLQVYAAALCAAFDLVDSTGKVTSRWFELKGKLKAPVTKERSEFKTQMEAAGHKANVHVYWQRVKQASGYVTAGDAAKAAQSVDDKTLADLKTILNRIFKAESESVECDGSSEAKGLLIEAFESMGGDIEKIG